MEFKVFKNENSKILKEYWLTQSEWDALDKTTVQEGDIYHIVGTIDKGDLSADVNASLAKADSSLQKPTATLAKESFVKVGIDGTQKFDDSSYANLNEYNVFLAENTFAKPTQFSESVTLDEGTEIKYSGSKYKFRDNLNENVLATLGDISSASVAIEDESKTYITFKGSKFPSETRTIRANAGTVIDWGDGSVNTYTQQNDAVTHTYTDGSDYHKITLSGWTDLSGSPFIGDGFIDVIIGNNVTTMPAELFIDCPNLVSVTLPKSITTIEDSLFYACPKLEKLKILATTPPTLGNNPFEMTRPRIIVPTGNAAIALYKTADGWSDYSSRIVCEINYSSQLINKFPLSGESGTLTDIQYKGIVTLQSGMTIVHSGIYYNLQNIPSNSSDDYIFTSTYYTAGDAKLATGIITVKNDRTWTWTSKSVALTSNVSDNLNTLEAKLNENIIKDPSKTYLVWKGNQFPNSTNATFKAPAGCTINWGDGIVETFSTASTTVNTHTYTDGFEYHLISLSNYTVIDNSAFWGCSGLTSIAIGNSVTSIGNSAFWVCSGLTSVTIPESVTSIGDKVFFTCENLTSVTIPASITSIGSLVFGACSKLKTIKVLSTTPPTLGSNVFDTSIEKIIVPKSAINTYKSASGWSTYADKIVYEVDSSDLKLYLHDVTIKNNSGVKLPIVKFKYISTDNTTFSLDKFNFYKCFDVYASKNSTPPEFHGVQAITINASSISIMYYTKYPFSVTGTAQLSVQIADIEINDNIVEL